MRKILIVSLIPMFLWIEVFAQTGHPKLENEESWTMIVLPDPQTYIKFEQNQPAFELMTKWIKYNKEKLNIELVLCEGDLVEQNNIHEGDGVNGNQNSVEQWTAVRKAFAVLDEVVPYIVCTGNHDYGSKAAENRYSQLNSYFSPKGMKSTSSILVGMLPNFSGEPTLENAYYEFVSPHDVKYLIASLEFNARGTIVQEFQEIFNREKYAAYKGIILTHSYMRSMSDDNVLIEKEGYKVNDVTHGKQLWEQLISPSKNIEMVFCGHVAGTGGSQDNVGYRKDKNAGGKEVHQMLFNAQADGGGWHGNGGDGWLRILEFLPDKKTVVVKTFSPLFAFSPITMQNAWRNEPFDSFRIELTE